ncbi:MAG: hypothetical protein AB7P97_21555 [Hyphomonadaceae bacterium]
MLSNALNKIATRAMPKIFKKTGTETVRIVRAAATVNEYGGAMRGGETESDDIPCVLMNRPANAMHLAGRWSNGEEYFDARIRMPAFFNGDPVEVRKSDRLRILARSGNNPERLYEVRDPQNINGVYLDVGVVTASAPTVDV